MKKGQYVQHINISDWGTGRVVGRQGDFVVVDFPAGQKKMKPEFLKVVKNPIQVEDPATIATKLWLNNVNESITKSIAEGTVPFLGSYLEQLTNDQRNRFRQYLNRSNDPITTFIEGLRRYPAAFAAFLTAKLSECYAEANLQIYEPIALELGVSNIPHKFRTDLHRSFCKAVHSLGLETTEKQSGHQWMVTDYMKQSGVPLNRIELVIECVQKEIDSKGQPEVDNNRDLNEWLADFTDYGFGSKLTRHAKNALRDDQTLYYIRRIFELRADSNLAIDSFDSKTVEAFKNVAVAGGVKVHWSTKPKLRLRDFILGIELPPKSNTEWRVGIDGSSLFHIEGQNTGEFWALPTANVQEIEIISSTSNESTSLHLWREGLNNEVVIFDSEGYFLKSCSLADGETKISPGPFYLMTRFDPQTEGDCLLIHNHPSLWASGPFALAPGESFSLQRGPASLSIIGRLQAALHFEGKQYRGLRGQTFYAGHELALSLALPEDTIDEDLNVRLVWRAKEIEEITFPIKFTDRITSNVKLNSYLEEFEPGLGQLLVEIRRPGGRVIIRRSDHVWNGLLTCKNNQRFVCARLPANLEEAACQNLKVDTERLSITFQNDKQNKFELIFCVEDRRDINIFWPVPGIFVSYISADGARWENIRKETVIERSITGQDYLEIISTIPGELRFRNFRHELTGEVRPKTLSVVSLLGEKGAGDELLFCTNDNLISDCLVTLADTFEAQRFEVDVNPYEVTVSFSIPGQIDGLNVICQELLTNRAITLNAMSGATTNLQGARLYQEGCGLGVDSYKLCLLPRHLDQSLWILKFEAIKGNRKGRITNPHGDYFIISMGVYRGVFNKINHNSAREWQSNYSINDLEFFRRVHGLMQLNYSTQVWTYMNWLETAWEQLVSKVRINSTMVPEIVRLYDPVTKVASVGWVPTKSLPISAWQVFSVPSRLLKRVDGHSLTLRPISSSYRLVQNPVESIKQGNLWVQIVRAFASPPNCTGYFDLGSYFDGLLQRVEDLGEPRRGRDNVALGPDHYMLARQIMERRLRKAQARNSGSSRRGRLRKIAGFLGSHRGENISITTTTNIVSTFHRARHLTEYSLDDDMDCRAIEIAVSFFAFLCRTRARDVGNLTDILSLIPSEDTSESYKDAISGFIFAMEVAPELFSFYFLLWEFAINSLEQD